MKIRRVPIAILLVVFSVILLSACSQISIIPSQPRKLDFLTARGTALVDESGDEVILKGCNLGSWLNLEMRMMDTVVDGSIELGWRLSDAGQMETKTIMGTDFPVRLKIVRRGKVIERYFAPEKETWTKYESIEFPALEPEAYVGMFCVSHNAGRLAKTEHRNIKLVQAGE